MENQQKQQPANTSQAFTAPNSNQASTAKQQDQFEAAPNPAANPRQKLARGFSTIAEPKQSTVLPPAPSGAKPTSRQAQTAQGRQPVSAGPAAPAQQAKQFSLQPNAAKQLNLQPSLNKLRTQSRSGMARANSTNALKMSSALKIAGLAKNLSRRRGPSLLMNPNLSLSSIKQKLSVNKAESFTGAKQCQAPGPFSGFKHTKNNPNLLSQSSFSGMLRNPYAAADSFSSTNLYANAFSPNSGPSASQAFSGSAFSRSNTLKAQNRFQTKTFAPNMSKVNPSRNQFSDFDNDDDDFSPPSYSGCSYSSSFSDRPPALASKRIQNSMGPFSRPAQPPSVNLSRGTVNSAFPGASPFSNFQKTNACPNPAQSSFARGFGPSRMNPPSKQSNSSYNTAFGASAINRGFATANKQSFANRNPGNSTLSRTSSFEDCDDDDFSPPQNRFGARARSGFGSANAVDKMMPLAAKMTSSFTNNKLIGPAPAQNQFGIPNQPSAFTQRGNSAFGAANQPNAFGLRGNPNFGAANQPNAFGQLGSSAFGAANHPSPFAQRGNSAFAGANSQNAFGQNLNSGSIGANLPNRNLTSLRNAMKEGLYGNANPNQNPPNAYSFQGQANRFSNSQQQPRTNSRINSQKRKGGFFNQNRYASQNLQSSLRNNRGRAFLANSSQGYANPPYMGTSRMQGRQNSLARNTYPGQNIGLSAFNPQNKARNQGTFKSYLRPQRNFAPGQKRFRPPSANRDPTGASRGTPFSQRFTRPNRSFQPIGRYQPNQLGRGGSSGNPNVSPFQTPNERANGMTMVPQSTPRRAQNFNETPDDDGINMNMSENSPIRLNSTGATVSNAECSGYETQSHFSENTADYPNGLTHQQFLLVNDDKIYSDTDFESKLEHINNEHDKEACLIRAEIVKRKEKIDKQQSTRHQRVGEAFRKAKFNLEKYIHGNQENKKFLLTNAFKLYTNALRNCEYPKIDKNNFKEKAERYRRILQGRAVVLKILGMNDACLGDCKNALAIHFSTGVSAIKIRVLLRKLFGMRTKQLKNAAPTATPIETIRSLGKSRKFVQLVQKLMFSIVLHQYGSYIFKERNNCINWYGKLRELMDETNLELNPVNNLVQVRSKPVKSKYQMKMEEEKKKDLKIPQRITNLYTNKKANIVYSNDSWILVANRDFKEKEVVFYENILTSSGNEDRSCAMCHKWLDERFFPCQSCNEEVFCNYTCHSVSCSMNISGSSASATCRLLRLIKSQVSGSAWLAYQLISQLSIKQFEHFGRLKEENNNGPVPSSARDNAPFHTPRKVLESVCLKIITSPNNKISTYYQVAGLAALIYRRRKELTAKQMFSSDPQVDDEKLKNTKLLGNSLILAGILEHILTGEIKTYIDERIGQEQDKEKADGIERQIVRQNIQRLCYSVMWVFENSPLNNNRLLGKKGARGLVFTMLGSFCPSSCDPNLRRFYNPRNGKIYYKAARAIQAQEPLTLWSGVGKDVSQAEKQQYMVTHFGANCSTLCSGANPCPPGANQDEADKVKQAMARKAELRNQTGRNRNQSMTQSDAQSQSNRNAGPSGSGAQNKNKQNNRNKRKQGSRANQQQNQGRGQQQNQSQRQQPNQQSRR